MDYPSFIYKKLTCLITQLLVSGPTGHGYHKIHVRWSIKLEVLFI